LLSKWFIIFGVVKKVLYLYYLSANLRKKYGCDKTNFIEGEGAVVMCLFLFYEF